MLAEVLTELRTSGLSPADRAKVRLLVGDRSHLESLAQGAARATASCSGFDEDDLSLGDRLADLTPLMRKLQSSGADTGMSTDTIAIVLSVLVGAVGYVVQVGAIYRPPMIFALV
eukprot:SAG31_NODE_1112_length_9855_cov_13.754203_9_plen_115_part_00